VKLTGTGGSLVLTHIPGVWSPLNAKHVSVPWQTEGIPAAVVVDPVDPATDVAKFEQSFQRHFPLLKQESLSLKALHSEMTFWLL